MSAQRCRGLFGLLFGHHYEPRYSIGAIPLVKFKCDSGDPSSFMESLKPRTYNGDVCYRCGHVANQQGASS